MIDEEITEKYLEFSNKLEIIKEQFIDLNGKLVSLLEKTEFQTNPELNESIHVQIYSIKKIIETFENILEKTEYLPIDKQVIFISLFSEDFLTKITNLYGEAIIELENVVQKI